MNPISRWLTRTWLYKYTNRWSAFHIMGGGVLGWVFIHLGMTSIVSIQLVFVFAILWEVFEWYIENGLEPYNGNAAAWLIDSVMDVLYGVGMAILVVT